MKKFLRKLRTSDQPNSSASSEQLNEDRSASNFRYDPQLKDLAEDPDRFGLRLIPLLPLEHSTTTDNFDVDIVAVHGLGGDFFRTWTKPSSTEKGKDVFWLSQLLPVDLPGARIYSFGYESRPAFSRSVASIRELAKQLLQSLLDRMEAGSLRPTIFICHSLGGIVVKQAMISANENERFAEVLRTTRAIMFMGTPHRGSDIATLLGPLVDTINFWLKLSGGSIIAGAMRADLVDTLARNSKALDEINESFVPRTKDKHIVSCFELEWPEKTNQLIVTKQSALLGIPGEEDIPLQANHMSMCRFSSLQDPRYRLVANALLRIIRTISARKEDVGSTSAQSLYSLTDSERRYTSYFKRDFQSIVPSERVEGTCRWLLGTSQYQKWQEDESSAVLWITGDAGCGKTTLLSFMTEELKTENARAVTGLTSIVMAFSCAKDVSARNDGQSIVCGLLISILTSRKNVIQCVKKKFAPVKHEFGQSLEFLWNIFMYALDVASCDCYYIIIDALDECQARSREKLLLCIRRLLDAYKGRDELHQKKLKLMLSSQPQTMTEWNALDNSSDLYHVKIEDRPPGMSGDILAFIDYKVDQLVQLRRINVSNADGLKKALYQKTQNSFLWVSLVLTYMKTTILLSTKNPHQLLAQLPDDIKEAYTRYLPASTPQNAGIIRRCVQLLIASYRTLSIEEVGTFLGIELENVQPVTQQQLKIIQNSLELMFGPLVRFPDLRVDFVHSTVKDYFLELGEHATGAAAETYGTKIESAHLALAEACVNYLLREEFSVDLFKEVEPSSAATVGSPTLIDSLPNDEDNLVDVFNLQDVMFFRDEEDTNDEYCSFIRGLYAPFDYAASNWAHHFASCEHIAPDTLKQKVRSLSNPRNNETSNWYKYMAHHSKTIVPSIDQLDELLVAAMFDHPEALQRLLSHHDETTRVLETRCKVCLFWAASQGHSRIVQALLQHGTPPNFLENGQSPLIAAIIGGHQDVCSTLLQAPVVDPNFVGKNIRSPLVHAVASDQHEIILMLLAHKDILVDIVDSSGFTPLLEAAFSGCLQCLRYLQLDRRSDFAKHDNKGRNVLSYAACTNSLASVELILKNLGSKEIHNLDNVGRNAISYAAERSVLPMVKKLCKSHISVAQRDTSGRNTVSWAVSRPSTLAEENEENTVLQFLVEKFPQETDTEDHSGWTPLLWAMDRPGDLKSVKILVEVGRVNVNQQDHSGNSVLSWAASEGFSDIISYLLQVPQIQKNLRNHTGRTPISYAAGSGSVSVLQQLLDNEEVDPSIADYQGRTPLDWARRNHHDGSVEALKFLDLSSEIKLDGGHPNT